MNPIVTDLETTGLDPHRHGICSIGAKIARTGAEFYIECRIADTAEIEEAAMRVNGFTEAQVRDPRKPTEAMAFLEFLRFAGWADTLENWPRVLLAGMNIGSFDFQFLKRVADEISPGYSSRCFANRTIDLHSVAIHHALTEGMEIPPGGFNTDAIYELLGLPQEPKPHHALTGARCEFAAFQTLFRK